MRIRSEASVIRKTIIFIIIQCILIVIVFGVYIFNSYRNIRKSIVSSTNNLVEVYGRELDNKIKNADMLLEQMIYKNDNYKMLQSSKEFDRYYASIRLKGMMEEYVTLNQYANICIIAESKYNTCLDYSNTLMSLEQRNLLRGFIMDKAALGHTKAQWEIGNIGNDQYLYKIYVWQNEAAAVLISMDKFLGSENTQDISNTALVLYEPATGNIWGSFGDIPYNATVGNKIKDINDFIPMGEEYVLYADNYCIKAYAKDFFNLNFLQFDMWLMLALIAILIAFTGVMIDYLSKSIIKPVGSLQKNMERVRLGDYELRIKDEFGSREFNILRDTFNKLMDEIVGLKIQSYEKQISLQETELRNIKLQIRPHFFLNAMTTISSLSQQNKNDEIRKYIDSLSKNIRYMFRAGLHTVALDEEIRHVENYFEMQELKYPGCVFYYIDAPDDTRDWKIPQMFIHNVIENEYKYAVDVSKMLTILIKAEIVEKDGESMLRLEIEDDGKGYPEDVVEAFVKGSTYDSNDGSRVGLWSIKRILEIMYERKDLFEIGNIEPHGCKSTMYIPKVPKHEVNERERINID